MGVGDVRYHERIMELRMSSGISDQPGPIPFWSYDHGDELYHSIGSWIRPAFSFWDLLTYSVPKTRLCYDIMYRPKRPDKSDLSFGIKGSGRSREVITSLTFM